MTQTINTGKVIKVLYIIDSFLDLAGAERNLFEIVTRIDKQKFQPFVFVLQEGSERLEKLLKKEGIAIKNLKLKRIYGWRGLLESIKLIYFIMRNNIKIVVTYHEGSDFLGSILAKISGVPIIISSRRDMGYKLKKRHIAVYRLINRFFNKIFVVSDAVKNTIFEREGVLWSKMLTVYNGVDLEKFSVRANNDKLRKDIGLNNNWPVIGIIAGLRPIKGHKYFLESAALVVKQFPKINFLIVGWNFDDGYFTEIKRMVNDLGLQKNVIFTGGRSDTNNILSLIDIFVLTSINEGFSNAIIEAMAAGKPIVATKSGGTSEAIEDQITGILVPAKDAPAIARETISILKDADLADRLSRNARKQAQERFDINNMVKNIERIYFELLLVKDAKQESCLKDKIAFVKWFIYKILKDSLSILLYYITLYFMKEKLWIKKNQLLILTYHRVNDEQFDPLGMNVNTEDFERQIRYFKKRFNIISLQDAINILKNGSEIPSASIVITFDDGYEDNFSNAFPILNTYNIPATIFLSAGIIEERKNLWFDLIIEAIKRTKKKEIDLNKFHLPCYRLDTSCYKELAIKEIIRYCKHFPRIDINAFINLILNLLEVEREELEGKSSMLNWAEIQEMRKAGITFGNHGFDHSILTTLSQNELKDELLVSKKILEERLGTSVNFFSYPNGSVDDFDLIIKGFLIDYGYQASLSLINGVNDSSLDLYALRRLCITKGMYLNYLNIFSEKLFFLHLSGIFHFLKNLFPKIGKVLL